MELLNSTKVQVAQSLRCRKVLSKIIRKHGKEFASFGKNCDEILSEIDI